MRIVIMYTRPNKDVEWFDYSGIGSYGLELLEISKSKKVQSKDELVLWDFIDIPDVEQWKLVRSKHREARAKEWARKESVGISVETVEFEEGVGDEFFEFLTNGEKPTERGSYWELGVDVDISKFFA